VDVRPAPLSLRLGYVPALDGVRAVAITLVVVWHAFHWPVGGFLGVHVFFVLSGFLITTLLLEERRDRGRISLRHFYLRRALRLFPALFVFLAAYSCVQTVRALMLEHTVDLSTSLKGVLYGLFYVSNVVQAGGLVLGVPISHLWSLATEEQFYVLWPLVLVAALSLGASRRSLIGVLAVAVAVLAAHRLQLTLSDAPRERLYFAPDMTFDPILVGCVAGVLYVAGRRLDARRWSVATAVAVGIAAACVVTFDIESRALYAWALVAFSGAVALALLRFVSAADAALPRALAAPPVVFLGRISYSLYLWHPLTIDLTRKVIAVPVVFALPIAVALATASYYLVERPFLRLKRRDRARVEGTAADDASTGFASDPETGDYERPSASAERSSGESSRDREPRTSTAASPREQRTP